MISATGETIDLPETAAGRKRRRRRRIGLIIAVVVLVVGAGWAVNEVVRTCGSLGSQVYRIDGECVGVTDGSYVFDPAFEKVQQEIAQENTRVREDAAADGSSYVTVALLNLLTPTDNSATPAEQIRSQLEGAYTAQRRINEIHAADESLPQIQLVLANQGNTPDQWRPVADQLAKMANLDNSDHLVAVIGLGVSTTGTQQRARDLSARGIPMVGAIITADGLDNNNVRGLIRVSPSNQDYVEALRGYVDTLNPRPSAMVVFDDNSDSSGDLFTKTLKEDLEQRMGDLINFPSQSFVGKSIPTGASSGKFKDVTNSICAVQPDVVFYAGREVDLDGFLQSLADRPCREIKPLTVLTGGSDVSATLEQWEPRMPAAKLTAVFAATTYPEGWQRGVAGTPGGYPEFLMAFQSHHGFDTRNLDDGGAIMMHDALLTAAGAVERAASGQSPPTAGDVRSQLLNLNGPVFQIRGASGTLSFSSRNQGEGDPIGKPIPVLEYPQPASSPSRQVALYVTD
ncbi:MAG: ABC transporter substrate-binding protein [Actinomycetes bacterium]